MSRHHYFRVWRTWVSVWVGCVVKGKLLRDIHPDGLVIKSVFVGIEPTEGRVALRPGPVFVCIHGSIVLVPKSETGAWLTLAIGLNTLTADGFLLITLELPLTASQATSPRSHAFRMS